MADLDRTAAAWTPEQGEHYRREMHRHAEEKAALAEALDRIVRGEPASDGERAAVSRTLATNGTDAQIIAAAARKNPNT